MDAARAFALGALQGLTEFLPVSSSGHLTILERAFGQTSGAEMLAWDVAFHASTLAAAIAYFGAGWVKELLARPSVVGFAAASSVPPVAFYFVAGGVVEAFKGNVLLLGVAFIFGGVFLAFASLYRSGEKVGSRQSWRPTDAVWVGLAQMVALLPGISRSGMAMGALILAGLSREKTFELAFLVGAPLMAGAILVKAREIAELARLDGLGLTVGAVAAFAFGLAALVALRRLVTGKSLSAFGAYAAAVGVICILWGVSKMGGAS